MNHLQRQKVDQLAGEYHSVSPRDVRDGTDSIVVDCYGTALPELCTVCGCEDVDHLGDDGLGHPFRMAWPVASFRVAPSGFVQTVTDEVLA